jgi:hypothetical protein
MSAYLDGPVSDGTYNNGLVSDGLVSGDTYLRVYLYTVGTVIVVFRDDKKIIGINHF